jgi:hypothetical protein
VGRAATPLAGPGPGAGVAPRTAGPAGRRWLGPVAAALARRPRLWATAARQVAVLAPAGWWRRPPWLPLPDAAYLAFRLQTQYGGDGRTAPSPGDVVHYLEWCRRMHRLGA